MDDKEKKLGLMRFWLVGTFVIIFAAVSIYVGMFTGLALFKDASYWIAMGITAALSVMMYLCIPVVSESLRLSKTNKYLNDKEALTLGEGFFLL